MLAVVAAWAVGGSRWKELKGFSRLPEVSFGMLGASLPIAISLLSRLLAYLKDRVHWAGFEFGKFGPPLFSSYFQFPEAYYFWYLPAAAFEEVIWRGYLQPRFVRRFGVIRGIFLLGLVWSASHFIGDFQGITEDYQVFLKLAFRLYSCLALGYVFGRLILRSGSIWPSALAHGFQNAWVLSSAHWLREQDSWLTKTIPWVCWGLLAVALFRFLPTVEKDDSPGNPEIGAEHAD
jgi:membrane protease YdiL (CAAX protease family)